MTVKRIIKKTFKILAWIAGVLLFLVLLVFILIQVPAVQNFAKNKAVAYLQNKLHTKVQINKLSIDFPKQVVLKGVYFEDQQKDTLLAGDELRVDIALLKLIKSEVVVDYIKMDGITANIYRTGKDTVFNYQYIVDAFSDTTAAAKPTDSSTGMTIKIGKLVLNNINSRFKDDQTGIDFLLHFDKSQTNFETVDPDKMIFSIPLISFEGISGHMYQNKPLLEPEPEAVVEAESNQPFQVQLALKDIAFKKINFDYRNDVSPMAANLNLGELAANIKAIDLAKLDVQINKVVLNDTKTAIELGKSVQTKQVKEEIKKETAAQANNPWKVSISKIDFDNNDISFDDNNMPAITNGMDYSHLKIDSLVVKADNMVFTPTGYSGNIIQTSFKEKSGFNLQQLNTNFVYNDSGFALKNLLVQTDKTTIQNSIAASYPSIETITKDIGQMYLDAGFTNSRIAVKDILLLSPQAAPYLKGFESSVLAVNAGIKGYVKDLSLSGIQLSGIGNTALSMNGRIMGLPDPKKTAFNLTLNNFQTTKTDLEKLLPPNSLPPSVDLPNNIKASGKFNGSATNFITDLAVLTDKGQASLTGSANLDAKQYNLKGRLKNVDVGYLTKQDTLVGKVTMSFAAKGSGFEPALMNANANLQVEAAEIKGYNYKNLQANAFINKGTTSLNATMKDENVSFDLSGEAFIKDSTAENIQLKLTLDSILFKPLGLATNDFRLRGIVSADVPVADINNPQGSILINDLVIKNDEQRYQADSIVMKAATTDSGKTISLISPMATAVLNGQYSLATIANGPMQVINKYYNLGIKDSSASGDKWKLDMVIIPDSMLFTLVPSLAGSDTIKASALFNGAKDSLRLIVNAPVIKSGGQTIDSLTFRAGNDEDKFSYALTVNSAGSKSFMVQKTSIAGYAANNQVTAGLTIKDANDKDKYSLGLKAYQQNNSLFINLLDSLQLDYDRWSVDTSNYIMYDSTGLIVHNFALSKDGQLLKINSKQENVNAPVDIALKDFRIKTLTNFAEQDSLLADGTINGTAEIRDMVTNPVFTANLNLDSITYNTDTIGNIAIKVNNQTANAFDADVAITGNENDIRLTGKYFTGEGRMDLLLAVNNFNMAVLKAVSNGAVTDASGSLTGKVDIKGTTSKPDINGGLTFLNTDITPAATGEKLHFDDESIVVVSSQGIRFNQFTMKDSSGNKAILDGNIATTDFTSYNFDLTLKANDFQLLNSTKKQNALYYGRLNIDADVSVKGAMMTPVVNADLKINKATDVTFVLPSVNPEIEDRQGVVQFFDAYGATESDSLFIVDRDSLTTTTSLGGLELTGTIQSDTAALITLVTDERNGDAVKIKGRASLSGGIDKSGKMSLTGDYQLQSGSYQITLSVLKRQFTIQPGSTITWNGDPLSATLNITAQYVANTQPINLLQSEITSLPTADINRYKSKVPFNVLLTMKGDLMKPQISFDIELPDDQKSRWPEVENKLTYIRGDDAELNKQVFALLLLGRFVQENPLKNSAEGTSLATTAKSSVSKILADQLNNLAGSLIQGVDLNFGINSEDDYTSGTATSRTDLNVGVSKKLLNDRIKVSVGSNFELEGPSNTNENASNIAGDIAIDYMLSKDGRYLLRAYRRNRYEGVVEGQVVESGVSFIFTLDFNNFRQLLRGKRKRSNRAINSNQTDVIIKDSKKSK